MPAGVSCTGVIWHEERDVREVRVRFAGPVDAAEVSLQYWARTWPPAPPAMPTIEDPQDDMWRGDWLTAQVNHDADDGNHVFTFRPLAKEENGLADHLPGVKYRRTLKMRLLVPADSPRLESLEMFSGSTLKPLSLRIELGCGENPPAVWSGALEIHNGRLLSARPWGFDEQDVFQAPLSWKNVRPTKPKGVIADLLAASPSPAGSFDMTVVTMRGCAATADGLQPRTFSFNTLDLERGPIYVPDFHVFVTKADDSRHFSEDYPSRGRRIRDQIPEEPEQTFERATREIPPLDPWVRQRGDRVYLPVAADASWQKFAVEYGGDILISKRGTKAKGKELRRLQWKGDSLRYRIGTGANPYYRDDHQATVSVADECLPIIINRWKHDGLDYEEEAFATLLSGPLDPNNPDRNEQTPAVLMLRLTVRNAGSEARTAHVWLTIDPQEDIEISGGRVHGRFESASRLRAVILPPTDSTTGVESSADTQGRTRPGIVSRFDVPASSDKTYRLCIPFVSDLGDEEAAVMESRDYQWERERVARYWRELIDKTTRFSVPEPEFNHMARFVVPHIHISTTKDPKSGLYMVPAASYNYQVYANETCFQVLMLDVLGDTDRATQYLRTLTELQGTRSFPGNYSEPHDGVFHGARVDAEYDYTAHNYGLDHGTVLWTLARHYFYTRDAVWLKETLPHMLKAVEWIERQRAATRRTDADGRRVLEYGLLPAGHLEDNGDWGYWYSVNAYCVAGMLETAAAMQDIQHLEAERMRRQAIAYRDDLRTAVLRSTERAPVTRMRDGSYAPYVPTRAYQRFRGFGPLRVQFYSRYNRPDVLPCYRLSATREVLYGPMILLNLDIFAVNEPIADWILDDWEDNLTLSSSGGFNVHGFTDDQYWFSQGGLVFQSNLQNPVLVYLKRHEVPAAIRGLYNAFVSCLHPEVNTFTEEYREWRHGSGPFYKSPDEARFVNRLRDALVLESGKDLLLASGVPRRWLASEEGICVDRINSYFGPVGFTLKGGEEARTVVATVHPPTRNQPEHLWLYARLPEKARIASVEMNGRRWTRFDPDQERIELPQGEKSLNIRIRY